MATSSYSRLQTPIHRQSDTESGWYPSSCSSCAARLKVLHFNSQHHTAYNLFFPPPCFPKFDGLSQPPSSFEDVFRHFVMNLSDFFWLHSHFSVHGRAHHSFPTSLVPIKSLYLASTFSASPHRGLRHSSQNQKQIQITI